MKALLMVSALAIATSTAFAYEANVRTVPLKDGSTVHVFADGTMAMQDGKGRVVRMKHGETMQTADGRQIGMVGDEVTRLDRVLTEKYKN